MAVILKYANETRRQAVRRVEIRGKPRGLMAGSYLSDLAALGKAIMLTPDEARRFNAKAHGYATNQKIPRARGFSDASDLFGELVLFMKKD